MWSQVTLIARSHQAAFDLDSHVFSVRFIIHAQAFLACSALVHFIHRDVSIYAPETAVLNLTTPV